MGYVVRRRVAGGPITSPFFVADVWCRRANDRAPAVHPGRTGFFEMGLVEWTIVRIVGCIRGFVRDICSYAAIMMSEANHRREETSGRAERSSLLEQVTPIARQINCLDIDRVADVCVTKIPLLVGCKFASLYGLDETNSILHLIGHNHPFPINKIVSLNQSPPSPMVLAVKGKELILTGNIDTHTKPVIRRSQRAFAENYETSNCAIVPLICHERVVGVLNLADKTNPLVFTRQDIALIELFGQLVGASIGNIKLFERMQRQATMDGPTGLMNHKSFYEALERELWRCRRYGGTISLIMADIDNLKKINDAHGHRAGDKANN
jgi:hypothetical protein